MKMKVYLIIIMFFILLIQVTVVYGQTSSEEAPLIASLITSPAGLITFFIEFALGIALGYLSIKVAKYIIALLAIFVIGVLLNIWQSGGLRELVTGLNLQWSKVYPVIQALVVVIGLTTVLPITLGFIIGFVVGLQR